tara:strand:+ start:779 stop:1474 length:696 start_codon:yes stop_codon:yes gene_type:complete
MEIKDLEIIKTSQSLFDSFNGFILSDDTKVFGKLLARTLLMNKVKDIPGDIVECGVFKGTGILTFLKLKKYLNPNSGKKVLGFDFFDTDSLIDSLSSQDKLAMSTLFEKRNFSHDHNYQNYLENVIQEAGFQDYDYELIAGDISKTMPEYISNKPGLKISLLYLDLDLAQPTYDVLEAAWDRVSKGGIVVFDEYAFHHWSESQGVDKFFKDKNVQVENLNYIAPSAFVRKV